MDKEIKRLLKLSRIPNFRMSEKEITILNEWKAAQEPVKITKPRRTYKKKVTNEVKPEEKETGILENEAQIVDDVKVVDSEES